MHKSGETLKSLFKKGDFVVWRHWQMEYPQGAAVAGRDILIEDRGIVLKVKKEHRSNRLANGDQIKGLAAIEVWKAEVLFISGTRSDLPLVCLKHFGED